MVLECTMICVDDSEYMRNEDYRPSRLYVQQDGVQMICRSKIHANWENLVGLLSLTKARVLASFTNDIGHIITKLFVIGIGGDLRLSPGLKVAYMALKHRPELRFKMRIVAFVGSPVTDGDELILLGRTLRKQNVNVDIISFGEDYENKEVLSKFVDVVNGKNGKDSHLLNVPRGSDMINSLRESDIIFQDGNPNYDAGNLDYDFEANEDPELALALMISMEEYRRQQEEEERQRVRGTPHEQPQDTKDLEDELKDAYVIEENEIFKQESTLASQSYLSNTDGNRDLENEIRDAYQIEEDEMFTQEIALASQIYPNDSLSQFAKAMKGSKKPRRVSIDEEQNQIKIITPSSSHFPESPADSTATDSEDEPELSNAHNLPEEDNLTYLVQTSIESEEPTEETTSSKVDAKDEKGTAVVSGETAETSLPTLCLVDPDASDFVCRAWRSLQKMRQNKCKANKNLAPSPNKSKTIPDDERKKEDGSASEKTK